MVTNRQNMHLLFNKSLASSQRVVEVELYSNTVNYIHLRNLRPLFRRDFDTNQQKLGQDLSIL